MELFNQTVTEETSVANCFNSCSTDCNITGLCDAVTEPRRHVTTTRLVLYLMHVYIMPVIIVVGIIGNVLSCVVLLGSHMRRQSSSIYLATLAIADTGFLISLIIVWLAWVNIDLMNRPGWCQITVFLAYVSAFLSVWSVVSFTTERYIAVWHPFRRHVICSAKRAKIIIVSLTAFAFVLYSPSLWASTVIRRKNKYMCAPKESLMHIATALLNVDIIITLIIPSLLIVPLNICIVIKIYQTLKSHSHLYEDAHVTQQDSLVGSSSSERENKEPQPPPKKHLLKRMSMYNSSASNKSETGLGRSPSTPKTALQRRTDSQLKTTRTLVVISSFFIILNAPSHGFRIHGYIQTMRGQPSSGANIRGQEAAQLLYYINFAINFFLYSACAKRFRKTIQRMMKKVKYGVLSTCGTCSKDQQETTVCVSRKHNQTAL